MGYCVRSCFMSVFRATSLTTYDGTVELAESTPVRLSKFLHPHIPFLWPWQSRSDFGMLVRKPSEKTCTCSSSRSLIPRVTYVILFYRPRAAVDTFAATRRNYLLASQSMQCCWIKISYPIRLHCLLLQRLQRPMAASRASYVGITGYVFSRQFT